MQAQAALLNSKGNLCDAQHDLQQVQSRVDAAQKELAMAQERLNGHIIAYAVAHGETAGSWSLSQDGTKLVQG